MTSDLLRAMDETVRAFRALPDRDQRLLRAEMLEAAAQDILAYWSVEARPESIQ